MKRLFTFLLLFFTLSTAVQAGDYLTNTNQNVSFLRMPARGASVGIDGVYTNPAGLSYMEDGTYISFNIQNAYQTRTIDANYNWNFDGQNTTERYKGTASAPVIPSIFAVYKKGKYALSAMTAFTGGGGKASFDNGLPMFTSAVTTQLYASKGLTPDKYILKSSMKGRQYIIGAQIGVSYLATDWLSLYAGGRMNYFIGGYEGFVNVKLAGNDIYNMELDCDQSGWGLTPIIATDIKWNRFNFMLKYEFKASLNIENDTKKNSDEDGALSDFKDGVNTPSDVPALFSTALGYEIIPNKLRGSIEYHFFDDKNAGMAKHKEKYLTSGTNEYLAGIEWDVFDRLTLSCGGQITDYGLSDEFQQQTSFSCDSYSIGFGGLIKLNKKLNVNIGYFITEYSDYTKNMSNYAGIPGLFPGKDTYSRTNKVFGFGVDYKF